MAMIRRASSGIALAARWALNTVSSSSSRPAVPLGARALGSSSSLPAVPLGPGSSSSALALFASRFLPFSTSSAADSPNSKQTGFGSSDDLDGLPFDSVDVDPADGTLFLERKTKHEVIEILVTEEYYGDIKCDDIEKLILEEGEVRTCVCIYVRILYGNNFSKCMAFKIQALPDDLGGQIVIRHVRMSVNDSQRDTQVHVDELEGLLETRGINHSNLDFMIKYALERRANLKYDPLFRC